MGVFLRHVAGRVISTYLCVWRAMRVPCGVVRRGALAMEKARGRKANVELLRSSTTTPVTSHKTRAGLPNGTPATPFVSIDHLVGC